MQTPFEMLQTKHRQRRLQITDNISRSKLLNPQSDYQPSKIKFISLQPHVKSHRSTIEQLLRDEKQKTGIGVGFSDEKSVVHYYRCCKNAKSKNSKLVNPLMKKKLEKGITMKASKSYQDTPNQKTSLMIPVAVIKENPPFHYHYQEKQNAIKKTQRQEIRNLISQASVRSKTKQLQPTEKYSEDHSQFNDFSTKKKSKSVEITFNLNNTTKAKTPEKDRKVLISSSFARWKIIHSHRDDMKNTKTFETTQKRLKQLTNESPRNEDFMLKTVGIDSDSPVFENYNHHSNPRNHTQQKYRGKYHRETSINPPLCTKAALLTNSKQFQACLEDIGIYPERNFISYEEDGGSLVLTNFIKVCRKKRVPIQKYGDKVIESYRIQAKKKSIGAKYPDSNYCRTYNPPKNGFNHSKFRNNDNTRNNGKCENHIQGWENDINIGENNSFDIFQMA